MHYTINAFFRAVRQQDWRNPRRMGRHLRARQPEWDEIAITDHLKPEDYKSFGKEILKHLSSGNDRNIAIMSHSFVEDRLRWLLEMRFIKNLSQSKKNFLFKGVGPLSSYIAKIELAFALGLISEPQRSELTLIGEIRNKFAHNFHKVNFSDDHINVLCARLGNIGNTTSIAENYYLHCFIVTATLFGAGQALWRAEHGASQDKSA